MASTEHFFFRYLSEEGDRAIFRNVVIFECYIKITKWNYMVITRER